MAIEAITFDCAQTLIDVNWQMGKFAVESAQAVGLEIPFESGNNYLSLFSQRLNPFHEINRTRSRSEVRKFWLQLNRDWLIELQSDPNLAESILDISEQMAYSLPSRLFSLYYDVRPTLESLKKMNFKLAVISNWDVSLHRVLDLFDLTSFFDVVIASLEEGIEKPEKELFDIACNRLQVEPCQCFHVGDDLVDDYQGAVNAGFHSVMIDRCQTISSPPYIHSLLEIQKAIQW